MQGTNPVESLTSRCFFWKGGITSDLKSAIALRIAHGMHFLHSQNIIHFDLKAANLLCDLRDPERPVVKIADVGLSKLKLDTYVSGNMRGTLPWMAPELFPSLDSMPGAQGVIIDKVDEKVSLDINQFGNRLQNCAVSVEHMC